MDPISLSEYRLTPGLSVPYLIHRLIPCVSRIMLNGPNKAGKTFLGLQVAFAVARGEDFLGRSTKQGKVLYLQFDTPDAIVKERLDDLEMNGVNLSDNVILVRPGTVPNPFDVMNDSHRSQLDKLIYKVEPSLVIIDVLKKMHHLDENKSSDMHRLFDRLNVVFEGRAVMILHHTAKTSNDKDARIPRPSESGRGSSFTGGECDANWLLWPTEPGQAILSIDSRFDEEVSLQAVRNPETGLWSFPDEEIIKTTNERLIALCNEFPMHTHHQLAEIVKQRYQMSRPTYYRRMSGLKCRHSLGGHEGTPSPFLA